MKLILLVTAVFIFATGLVSGQSVKQNDALEQEIRRLDLAHADAILRRDVEALSKLMAENVTTNHPTNKVVNMRERESLSLSAAASSTILHSCENRRLSCFTKTWLS